MAEWFIRVGDAERGPFSTDKFKALAAAGKITPETPVRRDDSKWLPASKVKGLFEPTSGVDTPTEPATPPSALSTAKAVADKAGGAIAAMSSSLMSLVPSRREGSADAAPSSLVAKVETSVVQLNRYVTEGQDVTVVSKVAEKVQSILTSTETIIYIAVQAKPLINMFPDCVALTSRRFIVYRSKMLGRSDFEDYLWRDLRNARLEENMIGSTIRFQTVDGRNFAMDYIPKDQGRQLYRIAQEHEERAVEEQRNRMLEEKRAAAGGVFVQTNATTPQAPTVPVDDPMQTLHKLKAMMDAGLITGLEFEAKKADILSRM